MFTNFQSRVVGFESCWDVSHDTRDHESQTMEIETTDRQTSTAVMQSVQVSTDPTNSITHNEFSESRLIEWLKKIEPSVMRELQENIVNPIFKKYNPYEREDKKVNMRIILQQTLEIKNSDATNALPSTDDKMPIIGSSWSLFGNTLAIITGFSYHDKWCEHESGLYLFSKRGNSDFKQIKDFKLRCCATCVTFHPNESNILALTTFIGEVMIYNFEKLTDKNPSFLTDTKSHVGKAITSVQWLSSNQILKYFTKMAFKNYEKILITGATDGKIIVWKVDTLSDKLSKHMCFEIRLSTVGSKKHFADINCFDFIRIWERKNDDISSMNKREFADDYFVIGTKTGEIILCRTSLTTSKSQDAHHNPCVSNLTPHNASILCVKFSPLKSWILVSLGADQEIRIYNIYLDSPTHIIALDGECRYVEWLPNRENLIFASLAKQTKNTKSSAFRIVNVTNGKHESIETSEDVQETAITSVNVNYYVGKMACGNFQERIKIYTMIHKGLDE